MTHGRMVDCGGARQGRVNQELKVGTGQDSIQGSHTSGDPVGDDADKSSCLKMEPKDLSSRICSHLAPATRDSLSQWLASPFSLFIFTLVFPIMHHLFCYEHKNHLK